MFPQVGDVKENTIHRIKPLSSIAPVMMLMWPLLAFLAVDTAQQEQP